MKSDLFAPVYKRLIRGESYKSVAQAFNTCQRSLRSRVSYHCQTHHMLPPSALRTWICASISLHNKKVLADKYRINNFERTKSRFLARRKELLYDLDPSSAQKIAEEMKAMEPALSWQELSNTLQTHLYPTEGSPLQDVGALGADDSPYDIDTIKEMYEARAGGLSWEAISTLSGEAKNLCHYYVKGYADSQRLPLPAKVFDTKSRRRMAYHASNLCYNVSWSDVTINCLYTNDTASKWGARYFELYEANEGNPNEMSIASLTEEIRNLTEEKEELEAEIRELAKIRRVRTQGE